MIEAVLIMLTLAAAGGYLLLRWGTRLPAKFKRLTKEELRKLLTALLYRGFDSGLLTIEVTADERFVQFRKDIRGALPSLQLGFPRSPWSKGYYTAVQKLLISQGADFEFHEATTDGPTREFLIADLGQDVELGASMAITILEDVFAVELERDCVAYLSGISPDPAARIGF